MLLEMAKQDPNVNNELTLAADSILSARRASHANKNNDQSSTSLLSLVSKSPRPSVGSHLRKQGAFPTSFEIS